MGLELLREADMILDACGRPTPPPGYKFIDLPRGIPYAVRIGGGEGSPGFVPFSQRIQNTSATMFICNGIAITGTDTQFRVKWPSGRYFHQNPQNDTVQGPGGVGPAQFALNAEEPIESGGKITIEIGGINAATVELTFWGFLRYLLRDTGSANDGSLQCVVGYPAYARSSGNVGKVPMMGDPIRALQDLPRYICGPNQNIMAPEFLLGNQHTWETPAGFEDEPFNLFSDPISVDVNTTRLGVPVLIPGNDLVILRRWRATVAYEDEDVTGVPVVGLRTPDGFSITGADLIPFPGFTGNAPQPPALFEWIPFFPTLHVRAGDRLILDLGNINGAAVGAGTAIISTFEFEGVKRRRKT